MAVTTTLYLLAGILMLIGLAGIVVPILPGLPLTFAGMLLAAWAGDFQTIGGWTIAALAGLTALALAVDLVAGLLGAKRVGASRKALLGAFVGTVIGLFFGIPGIIIGPFAGALIGEIIHGRDLAAASKVGFGTWLGMAVGGLAKVMLACVMLGIFALAILIH